ncbi:MAG: peptidyl-prolyl cis-trans isomerase [Clostridia bacterium]
MKRRTIIAAILALALCLSAIFAGCAKSPLAAKVGEREITVQQLQNMYDNNSSYASYYGYPLTTEKEVEAFQDYVLDQLISSEMKVYQARLSGITLTDEEQAEAKKKGQESYDATYQSFVDAAKDSGAEEVNVYAKKLFTDALARNNSTVGKMKKELLADAQDSILVEKHKSELLKDKQLSDEELKTKYDTELAAQKTLFASDPSMYFTYEANSMYGYSYMPLVVPEGFFRVRHILVKEEAQAKEVKAKLDAGEDFETLLTTYNTDPGMTSEEFRNGYLVGKGANFVPEFLEAALVLTKDGDLSDIVKSEHGYHIIKRLKAEPARDIPYDEVKESFDVIAQGTIDAETYNQIVTDWMADTALVVRYPENYRTIGKAALAAITPAPDATVAPDAVVTAAPEADVTAAPETTEAPKS